MNAINTVKTDFYVCIFCTTAKTEPRMPTDTTIDDDHVDWSLNS